MTTIAESIQAAALAYAELGLHVLPLVNRGKIPRIGKAWHTKASTDLKQIERWWGQWPDANVGVQLGPRSGIIDIECDSPEAEKQLGRLAEDMPVCPAFSGARGKHRLFRWQDDLPAVAVTHIGAIEVRLGGGDRGAQTVFPPSIHPSGKQYQWLPGCSLEDIEPAAIPERLATLLWNMGGEEIPKEGPEAKPIEHWERILQGATEGTRHVDMASHIGHVLHNTLDLADQTKVRVMFLTIQAVNDRNNPPLPDKELETLFVDLLKKERTRRVSEETAAVIDAKPEQQVRKPTGQWSMVIVRSDPIVMKLFAPAFADAPDGFLLLTPEQVCSWRALRVQAAAQAHFPLPTGFRRTWEGHQGQQGLFERLMLNATYEDAPADTKRGVVIAEMLRERLSNPAVIEEGGMVDPRGRPCRLPTGEIVFLFSPIWDDMRRAADQVTRRELSGLLERVGATWFRQHQRRYKMLPLAALLALDGVIADGEPGYTYEGGED